MGQRGFFARLWNLWRGMWGLELSSAEAQEMGDLS